MFTTISNCLRLFPFLFDLEFGCFHQLQSCDLFEIFADKFCGSTPCNNINKVGSASLFCKVAVNRNGESCHAHTLWVLGQQQGDPSIADDILLHNNASLLSLCNDHGTRTPSVILHMIQLTGRLCSQVKSSGLDTFNLIVDGISRSGVCPTLLQLDSTVCLNEDLANQSVGSLLVQTQHGNQTRFLFCHFDTSLMAPLNGANTKLCLCTAILYLRKDRIVNTFFKNNILKNKK